ncbi:MAG: helix-turn-helix domain-containing protein [Rhodobacteraceae bacterium]|jgi:transposase-like protein|nr:helix-turn-helix domain-containing protein [Paracoccaceae bacterium]
MTANLTAIGTLPDWVPSAVRLYLTHTENGSSLREIARAEGVHASTVLRQVRRFENRRDDPLVDCALGRLLQPAPEAHHPAEGRAMTQSTPISPGAHPIDEARLDAEARRVLPRLAERGAVMAVAPDMDRAVVMRDGAEGAVRLAVLDRPVAEAFALRDWIICVQPGRVSRYEISPAGRTALRRLGTGQGGGTGAAQPVLHGEEETRGTRPVTVESPVTALARRRDREGNPFLTPDLVVAAERLREDFEIAQMGPRVTQDWERFLTGPVQGAPAARGAAGRGSSGARDRVSAALRELGPGLADMALRCCCHLEGLETAERRLGWSARSGKIVLRIALLRLKRHYDDLGDSGKMMG